jgi:hypothetical protein
MAAISKRARPYADALKPLSFASFRMDAASGVGTLEQTVSVFPVLAMLDT